MNITILCVGKIKENYWKDAIAEYVKRLSKYCNITIKEVEDEKTPENASSHMEQLIMAKEAERMNKYIKSQSYLIALALEGTKYNSEKFSKHIQKLGIDGKSDITFIIGGSIGIHDMLKKRASEMLSFSDMTFPHQLMRVILTEQLYRAFRIQNNEPYHK